MIQVDAAVRRGFASSAAELPTEGAVLWAGPNAMISLPNATTDLGLLCTVPILQDGTYVCGVSK
jgi:hypothetical protein